jgi:hypothetical protein
MPSSRIAVRWAFDRPACASSQLVEMFVLAVLGELLRVADDDARLGAVDERPQAVLLDRDRRLDLAAHEPTRL